MFHLGSKLNPGKPWAVSQTTLYYNKLVTVIAMRSEKKIRLECVFNAHITGDYKYTAESFLTALQKTVMKPRGDVTEKK